MQWFLTLFCNCLPHSTVLRVWDLVFLEGNQILLKTALAIWDTLSEYTISFFCRFFFFPLHRFHLHFLSFCVCLSRIMPVKSADEFYSIMGVLTREMLEFGLMDANCLIKVSWGNSSQKPPYLFHRKEHCGIFFFTSDIEI